MPDPMDPEDPEGSAPAVAPGKRNRVRPLSVLSKWKLRRAGLRVRRRAERKRSAGCSGSTLPVGRTGRRREPMVMVALAAVVGILLDRLILPRPDEVPAFVSAWPVLGGAAMLAWLLRLPVVPGRCRRRSRGAATWLLVGVTAIFGHWHAGYRGWRDAGDVGRWAPEEPHPVMVRGAVVSVGPTRYPEADLGLRPGLARPATRLELRVDQVRDGARWCAAAGRLRLRVLGEPPDRATVDAYIGRRVEAGGLVQGPPAPVHGGDWDGVTWFRDRRWSARLTVPRWDCLHPTASGRQARSSASRAVSLLSRTRARSRTVLARHVEDDAQRLVAGILLGERATLDRGTTRLFAEGGTVHLLCISGFHLGILAAGWWWLASKARCSRRTAIAGVLLATFLYAALVGARPPAVRAAGLILMLGCARVWGRPARASHTLSVAGLLVLVLRPTALFDAGAQLSFLAVAALARQWPRASRSLHPLDRLVQQAQPWWRWRVNRIVNGLVLGWKASAAVWCATAPLAVYHFHLLAPAGIFWNPILWLPLAVILFCGMGVLLFSTLAPGIADVLGFVCTWQVRVMVELLAIGSDWPGHCFYSAAPAGWWVAGFYGLLAGWWWRKPVRRLPTRPRESLSEPVRHGRNWISPAAAGWLFLWGSWMSIGWLELHRPRVFRESTPTARASFIAVGHGTSVLFEFPNGDAWLYDAGCLGDPEYGGRRIASYLWSRRIRHLDAVVVSHADIDHFNAVPYLLERFSVGRCVVSDVARRRASPAWQVLEESLRSYRVPLHVVSDGYVERIGPGLAEVEVLHPPPTLTTGSDNAHSVVIGLECLGQRFLLPGDLETPGMELLLARPSQRYPVLLAPHHGSPRSRPEAMARWCRPRLVVISGGTGGAGVRVAWEQAAPDAMILHTEQTGTIELQWRTGGTFRMRMPRSTRSHGSGIR